MRHPRLVLAIFVLSGAAGLIYEVVWSRQLVLVFGNTTQAVSTILTGFFGGMAIGAYVGGRLADRVRSPLRLYGAIELVLVVVVLLTPITFRLLHEVYRGAFAALEDQPGLLALVRFGLAVLALAPATVLMGATLPTLTRYADAETTTSRAAFGGSTRRTRSARSSGRSRPGFVLIELLGLTGTLVVGAACSAAGRRGRAAARAATTAIGRDAGWTVAPSLHRRRPPDRSRHRPHAPARRSPSLVAFVSGLTSLGYQVLWTRLLSSGTGNSTYVFTLILAMFLIGIAIGALIFAVDSDAGSRTPVGPIAVAQVAIAAIASAGLVLVIGHPGKLDPVAVAGIGQAIVASAFCSSSSRRPSSWASRSRRRRRSSATIRPGSRPSAGALLAANTLGAIVATFVIPFFVIPPIGSPTAVAVLALVNVADGDRPGRGRSERSRVRADRHEPPSPLPSWPVVIVVGARRRPAADRRPERRPDPGGAARPVRQSAEDEIASVQAGARSQRAALGDRHRDDAADGRRQADADPAADAPAAVDDGARPSRSGWGRRSAAALIAGLQTDAVELVPSVPEDVRLLLPGRGRGPRRTRTARCSSPTAGTTSS